MESRAMGAAPSTPERSSGAPPKKIHAGEDGGSGDGVIVPTPSSASISGTCELERRSRPFEQLCVRDHFDASEVCVVGVWATCSACSALCGSRNVHQEQDAGDPGQLAR